MSALAQLQHRLARAIRVRDVAVDDLVSESPRVSRAVRLGVYQEAYVLRLDEALRSNYPKLHAILGDDDMLKLTMAYQEAHASMRPSIRWFGDVLPDFLASDERYAHLPILAELARFEWSLCQTFDASDAPVLAATRLAELGDEDWPLLQVGFHPSVHLLTLAWNAPTVWRALNEDAPPPAPSPSPMCWATWRHELQPRYRSLAEDEAVFIAALQAGQHFGEACEVLLRWHGEDDAPARAAGLLGTWLAEGWITRLSVTD